LINYLIDTRLRGHILEIIDLGAGTGANQRWLASRLPFQQRWIHLDHDPAISRSLPLPQDTMIIDDSVEALERLLAGGNNDHCLVGCSALLDVLTRGHLDAVCRAVIDNQVPALFSLSVTGTQTISPMDLHDQRLLDAFNDHQRRAGRAGPDAIRLAVDALHTAGYTVNIQETPWQLTASSEAAFVEQFSSSGSMPRWHRTPVWQGWREPGSSYDAPSSSSESSELRLGIATSWPCRADRRGWRAAAKSKTVQ
jgi:hypothetical protein